jgi:hypothetical protein
MGTPTVITFKGNDNHGNPRTIVLYRHYDGDPVTQLDLFATIIDRAKVLAHDYKKDAPHIADQCVVTPSTLTGLYIGETTGTFGMVASILDDYQSKEKPVEAYGEYVYTVDTEKGEILVTDNEENPVDPFSYIDRLHDEYQASHRETLDAAIDRLCGFGFTVSPGERPER